jgi:hypothetical protein
MQHDLEKASRVLPFIAMVLLHYSFLGPFYEKIVEAVQSDRYRSSAGREYTAHWARLKDEPDLSLKRDTARVFEG